MATKRFFILLWIGCLIGQIALIPYAQFLGIVPVVKSFSHLLMMTLLQGVVVWGVVCWLSYWVLKRVDLQPLVYAHPLRRIIYPGVVCGVVLGLVIVVLERTLFKTSALAGMHPPFWAGLLASIYGGLNEEVFMRLFLLTFVYWGFRKLFKHHPKYRSSLLWAAVIIVAIAFGAGHYIFGTRLVHMAGLETARIFLLNGIAGVVFGLLYVKRGLGAAVTAHFAADLLIHAFLI